SGGATACTSAGSDRPLVAVTTNILGDVARQVVGDAADVMVLMPPGADPHSFEVSAKEASRLRTADLVVENGLGLEEGVARHVTAAAEDGGSTSSRRSTTRSGTSVSTPPGPRRTSTGCTTSTRTWPPPSPA
ncbi:metal ABC transporter solute-binding protein, Zn/Mn family, partial [Mycobacteroides abscessus]|uniref:metal ABC transporter solute-binding protein, Zn/Mn family n=1 Tax=Mycobacteroides abscessus TaxID=36809 RepID=UPI0010424B9F